MCEQTKWKFLHISIFIRQFRQGLCRNSTRFFHLCFIHNLPFLTLVAAAASSSLCTLCSNSVLNVILPYHTLVWCYRCFCHRWLSPFILIQLFFFTLSSPSCLSFYLSLLIKLIGYIGNSGKQLSAQIQEYLTTVFIRIQFSLTSCGIVICWRWQCVRSIRSKFSIASFFHIH